MSQTSNLPESGAPAMTARDGAARGAGAASTQGVSIVLGEYAAARKLADGPRGPRYLAVHSQRHTSHLLHTPMPATTTRGAAVDVRAYSAAMARLQTLDQPHVLKVQAFGWETEGQGASGDGGVHHGPWAVTDYTGDADGVVTLAQLVRIKGGSLSLEESKRAMEQLLDASRCAHPMGLAHGPLTMEQVQVDRAGRLVIEFYALDYAMDCAACGVSSASPYGGGGLPGVTAGASSGVMLPDRAAMERAEVASIVRIGYQLVTGLLPIEPIIAVQEVIEDIDESWQGFFETGMGPIGFTSAAHAYSAARACRLSGDRFFGLGPVRMAIRTLLGGR
ncbi:MAG: hypothetical protein MUE97_02225 [Phycisphaerales bacterium]|nr:hypothetical protein [Phycisphaerales bacterium]